MDKHIALVGFDPETHKVVFRAERVSGFTLHYENNSDPYSDRAVASPVFEEVSISGVLNRDRLGDYYTYFVHDEEADDDV